MIVDPPLDAGALNAIDALALPAVADPTVGAPGTVDGVTPFDAADAALAPIALLALTVKVYAVPLLRPVTLMDVHGAVQEAVRLPGADVAV